MSKKLFTPGPTNVPQFIRVQLSKDLIHHRMTDYKNIYNGIVKKLKRIFNTKNDVIVLTSSGTGAMEASVVNLFSFDDEVLVINTGNFGKRFIEICNTFKLKVHHLDYQWGNTYDINDVKNILENNPKIKGVFVTYHETSTGVVNDLKELGEFVNTTNAILIADCISGMIVHPFEFDNWHIDCALAASQKGFLLPPGLSFVALSQKATKFINSSDLPKFYWDFKKYNEYFLKGQNPYTPAISLIFALDIALDYILDKGIVKIIDEKYKLRKYLEEKLEELGFELFIKNNEIRGNALVPVLVNENYDIVKLVTYLDNRYNISISRGQGKYNSSMLRIGILSEFTKEDIDELIDKINDFTFSKDN